MKFASLILVSALFAGSAFADVSARRVSNTSGIGSAQVFALEVSGTKPSYKQIAEEVGKRMRQAYHREGMVIESSSLEKVSLSKATRGLSQEDGLFKGLSKREQELLDVWVERNSVTATAYKMEVSGSWYGASGVSVTYIFLPTSTYDDVLAITYDREAEE